MSVQSTALALAQDHLRATRMLNQTAYMAVHQLDDELERDALATLTDMINARLLDLDAMLEAVRAPAQEGGVP